MTSLRPLTLALSLALPGIIHSETPTIPNPQLDNTLNTALLATPKLENDFYDWYERHAAVLKEVAARKANLILIGDSLTHMLGGSPTSNRNPGQKIWDEYFGPGALNLGFGYDRIQNVLWRLENGELANQSPRVVVILIGTNNFYSSANARDNTPAEIVEGITAVCDKVHTLCPESHILLLGLLPRGEFPTDPYRAPIQEINAALAKIPDRPWVTVADIGPHFLQSDGTISAQHMNDFLHMTEDGYRIFAENIKPILERFQQLPAQP